MRPHIVLHQVFSDGLQYILKARRISCFWYLDISCSCIEKRQGTQATRTMTDFAEKLTEIGSNALTSLSIAIGSHLGLFEAFGDKKERFTSHEIAATAKLKERYVREWLGVMVCSRIIEIDEDSEKYWLPEDRYKIITGRGPKAMFNGCLLSLPMLSQVLPDVMECFRLDGPNGVPYFKYDRFHEWRENSSAAYHTSTFLKETLPLVPGLSQKLETGTELCEIGCGTGHFVRVVAECYPKSTAHGYDISQEAIDQARAKAESKELANAKFDVKDVCQLPGEWTNKWEYIWVNEVIHDLPYPDVALREIHRVLKPGGYFIMCDISSNSKQRDNRDVPFSSTLYTFSLFHCMPISLYHEGGMGLGTCWGRQKAKEMIETAGFVLVTNETRPGDEVYICCKSDTENS